MQELLLKTLYCENQIACRFLGNPSLSQPLVMTIPGGPSLSGKYLDHFLIKLASQFNVNVGILDLPNHGDSIVSPTRLPMSYQSCLEMINAAIVEIRKHCNQLILFGQSFGARIAFDLLAASNLKINAAFLTGFPYTFQISQQMQKKISLLDLDSEQNDLSPEEAFVKNWKKILPLYTVAPLPDDLFEALSSNIKISGNERTLNDVPPIQESANIILKKSTIPHIVIVQGDVDGVVPDHNLSTLKSIIPSAHFYEIKNCGHFPMVENSEETLRAFSQLTSLLIRG